MAGARTWSPCIYY